MSRNTIIPSSPRTPSSRSKSESLTQVSLSAKLVAPVPSSEGEDGAEFAWLVGDESSAEDRWVVKELLVGVRRLWLD
jgi:hypothetical protein